MSDKPDDRSRPAVAYHWASRITSVALEMVLPGLAGYWLDGQLGTRVVFTVIGFGSGLTLGLYHLIQIAQSQPRHKARSSTTGPSDSDASERNK